MNDAKYYVNMNITKRFAMKEYFFMTEDDLEEWLESMNDFELDNINTIQIKTKRGWKDCYDEFLD